jgi:predicted unusual protein kinase regulating ubiquinone biosynthesis (AarF/ABC1/UbiB family)
MSAIAQLPYKKLRWQRGKKTSLARQREVFLSAFTFLFFLWWDNFWKDSTSRTQAKRAEWLVRNMLELGPTFIKIGQSLSTRVDLLPPEYISTLAQLQDKVPAFSAKEARDIIELELGKPLYTIFRDFDEIPLAAASLGQVHRATLHTGEDVVVKVQRAGLRKLFDLDFLAVGKLLKVFRRYFAWTWTLDKIEAQIG